MAGQLIPVDLLKEIDKILFVYPLAIGDYTYLQNCFKQFAEVYPHIKIHLWADEIRRTRQRKRWEFLRKYPIYDWLHASPFITKIYQKTYAPSLFKEELHDAQQENYPLVVSLSTSHTYRYARLTRKISPKGFVCGFKKNRKGFSRFFPPFPFWLLNRPTELLEWERDIARTQHVSKIYAATFERLFGFSSTPESRWPFVNIPAAWSCAAKRQIADWFFDGNLQPEGRAGQLIFINPYAKSRKRCWTLSHVTDLIERLRNYQPSIKKYFVINVVPEALEEAQAALARLIGSDCQLFSAYNHFFELPALLKECDRIISVETSIVHLGGALGIPVVALMRQLNPEWDPLDTKNSIIVRNSHPRDKIYDIPVNAVMNAIEAADRVWANQVVA